jgi:uncharacterized protein HemX
VRTLAGLVAFLAVAALFAPVASAQQAPGSPFGPLQSPAPPPAPTQTQTQPPTQTQPSSNSGGDSGPGKGVLALLFVAAILVLGAAVFVIGRDARRTVRPKRRVKASRPRTAEATGARAPGAPPPPPRKARRKRRAR